MGHSRWQRRTTSRARPSLSLPTALAGWQARGPRDVAAENRDVWIWDLARRNFTRLTLDPAIDRVPVWSPDGRRIIFSSDRAGVGKLFSQAADGTGAPEPLTQSGRVQRSQPA